MEHWQETLATAQGRNMVDRERLEAALEKVRSKVKDPAVGLFGPGSIAWRLYREQVMGIGGGRALLLQTAHPFVSHAVRQHSAYQSDPHGRGERTFKALFAWLFGDMEKAFAAARRTWGVHERIVGPIANRAGPYDEGTPYAANEQHALFWVHSTLWDTPWRIYELIFRPLDRDERNQFYEETKLFAYMFGIEDDYIPPTFEDFCEYNEKMFSTDILTVDEASMDVARYVLAAPNKASVPIVEWFKIMTAGLLPARIAHAYQFKWGRFEERVFEASIRALRAGTPLVPGLLRYSPIYRRAAHRVAGTRPGGIEKRINRAYRQMENSMARAAA